MEGDTIQALMDLALPQFGVGNRSAPVRKPWMVSSDSPASRDPTCPTDLARSPSPCLNLDVLSSDDAEESVIPRDISVTVLCSSEDDITLIGSDQVLSDVDLPAASDSQDRRQVQQTQELSPVDWFFRRTVSMGWSENGPDGQQQLSTCVQDSTPAVRLRANRLGLSVADLSPVVGPVVMQGVSQAESVHFSAPAVLGQPDPGSSQAITFEELNGDSSVPLSPNCVQAVHSQEMPADGSLFGVSPATPGFVMRPAGATQRLPGDALPLPLAFDFVNDPFFRKQIAIAQCSEVPGSDGPVTLPVYTMPTGASLMMGQWSIPTVLASGMSPRTLQCSTDMDRSDDATREGPFEAVASPMETEDSLLVTTGLPGCPYRITSYARAGTRRHESGFWITAPSSTVPGVHRCTGVGSAVVPLAVVLGGSVWRGVCHGSGGQPADGRCYQICRFCRSL